MERFCAVARSIGAQDRRDRMLRKIVTVVLISGAVAVSACNTVRGAAADVNSVANCTENAIDGTGKC
jgi:predicted small secreted protein